MVIAINFRWPPRDHRQGAAGEGPEGQSVKNFQLENNGIYMIQVTTDKQRISKKLTVCK